MSGFMSTQLDFQLRIGRGVPVLPARVELTTGGDMRQRNLFKTLRKMSKYFFSHHCCVLFLVVC